MMKQLASRGLRIVSSRLNRFGESPFKNKDEQRLIIHCAHHRCGSVWLDNVLHAVADSFGLRYQKDTQDKLKKDTEVFMEDHSWIDFNSLPPYAATHMIRDPRDIIVSAYFYHLWTKEVWAHVPREEHGGKTYQEYINSLDKEEGVLAEINRSAKHLKYMGEWNYHNPNVMEIKYEDMIEDERSMFRKMFQHYGFSDSAIEKSLGVADRYSFGNMTKRKIGEKQDQSHLRSGRSGQWQETFTDAHKAHFKELLGQSLINMGYESDLNW